MASANPEAQQFARDLIGQHGPRAAALLVGLNRATLANLAAGLDVMPATLTHFEVKRAELAAAAPVHPVTDAKAAA